MDYVSVVKAKQAKDGGWLFVVFDRNGTPLLVFPRSTFELPKQSYSDKEASVILLTKPKTVVSIEFDNSINAKKFRDFVSYLFTKKKKMI